MKRLAHDRLLALVLGILLVCAFCFAAYAENAADSEEFTIEDTTLVKYNGPGGEVTVPEGIEKVGASAFEDSKVTKVNLPESLKELENHCFFSCRELTEITLPASLEKIAEIQVFSYCSSLRAIRVAEGNPNYQSVDGVLFTADGKTLLCYPAGKKDSEAYSVPEGTETINNWAFDDAKLARISIPSTVMGTGRDNNPFNTVRGLQEVTVSPENTVFYAKEGVLYSGDTLLCYPSEKAGTAMKKEDFPAGLKKIADRAFCDIEYLESVEFPEGVESVGAMCFMSAGALKDVLFPASVEKIGNALFFGCGSLERVTVLNPETTISDRNGKSIFARAGEAVVLCGPADSKVQEYAEKHGLKFEALDPETATVTEAPAEEAEVEAAEETPLSDFTIEGTTLVKYNGLDREVTVPDGIEALGEQAFGGRQVTKVNLPGTLKEIGDRCFMACEQLTEVDVPEGVEVLSDWAFAYSGVTKVTLPETLKEIGRYCFIGCEDLEEMNLPASLEKIGAMQAFYKNEKLEAINIAEDNPNFVSVDGVLFTADGTKLLYYPAGKNRGGHYVIPEGTRELGGSAIGASGLKEIELPSTLEKLYVGNDFSSSLELENIRVSPKNPFFTSVNGLLLDQSGKLICYPAGRKGGKLEANEFPPAITAIAPYAFQHNRNLKSVAIPDGITAIDWMCFTWAESLERVILPASVNYISGYAFADCPNLRQIVILNPDTVFMLDDERFSEEYRATNDLNIINRSPNAVLYGYEGSTTQEYAEKMGDAFASLGKVQAGDPEAAAEPAEQPFVPGCAQ